MSSVARKPVFGVFNQIRHNPGCQTTEDNKRLELSKFMKKRDCTIYVAKTKALISCAVTAQLICAFVFACAKSRFPHDAVHEFIVSVLPFPLMIFKLSISLGKNSIKLPCLISFSWLSIFFMTKKRKLVSCASNRVEG